MEWVSKDNKLEKTFVFKDFVHAFSFLTKVALEAEKQQHHPEIFNMYNTVILKLQTHDAGNVITPKDYSLAKAIDDFYE